MPRKSKNKYMSYDRDQLKNAVQAVRDGVYSFGKASQIFNVPKSTIIDYANGKSNVESTRSGRNPSIPIELENMIAEKVVQAANQGFGITKRQLLLKVGRLCEKTKIKTPFKDGIPGDDWWRGFKSRHTELVLRKPEKLSTSRSRMMNRIVVQKYFDDLSKILTENPSLSASTIWNMDETGKQFEHNPTNVVARKGTRSLPGRTSNSRENITILACVNASGNVMPPMCIVKGKTQKSLQSFCTIDAPSNTVWTYQQKAWMNDLLGEMWFKQIFLANGGDARPQLLVLDSHRSHEVLGLLEAAKQENIIMLSLPPHCTHFLQPLDRSVFGPFSKAYNRACTEFLSQHPNNNINKQTWPRILKTSWESALTSENIKTGFQASGIYPFNAQAIPESAYAPSDAFDVPLQERCLETIQNNHSTPVGISVSDDTMTTATMSVPLTSNSVAGLELSPIVTVVNDQFMPVMNPVSLASTFEEISNIQTAEISSHSEIISSNVSIPSIEDVPLLFMALGTENIVLSEVSDSELNISANSTMWNNDIESIFSIPKSSASSKPKTKALTSHRLLTSDEVIKEKQEKIANKEKLEQLKRQRKEVREQKQANKKLKVEKM